MSDPLRTVSGLVTLTALFVALAALESALTPSPSPNTMALTGANCHYVWTPAATANEATRASFYVSRMLERCAVVKIYAAPYHPDKTPLYSVNSPASAFEAMDFLDRAVY